MSTHNMFLWILSAEEMPRRTHNMFFLRQGDSNEYPQQCFFGGEVILMSTHNICFYGGKRQGDSKEYPQHMSLSG